MNNPRRDPDSSAKAGRGSASVSRSGTPAPAPAPPVLKPPVLDGALQCCCGQLGCIFLQHNCTVLESVENDVRTAAKLGQVSHDATHDASRLTHHVPCFYLTSSHVLLSLLYCTAPPSLLVDNSGAEAFWTTIPTTHIVFLLHFSFSIFFLLGVVSGRIQKGESAIYNRSRHTVPLSRILARTVFFCCSAAVTFSNRHPTGSFTMHHRF